MSVTVPMINLHTFREQDTEVLLIRRILSVIPGVVGTIRVVKTQGLTVTLGPAQEELL